jgi:ubiquitin fusion degradation protein 1
MFNPLERVMRGPAMPLLTERLVAYPSVFCGREDVEKGDKILLPSTMLQKTVDIKINRGIMVFCVQNTDTNKQTYCGVLEFVAEPGTVYLPGWMFENLQLYEGQRVNVTLINDIKTASFVKLQPHKTEFIDLPNPRALLENELRNFTCLHEGDTIRIRLPTKKTFDIDILQLRPDNDYKACCIINCNMEVDFA